MYIQCNVAVEGKCVMITACRFVNLLDAISWGFYVYNGKIETYKCGTNAEMKLLVCFCILEVVCSLSLASNRPMI